MIYLAYPLLSLSMNERRVIRHIFESGSTESCEYETAAFPSKRAHRHFPSTPSLLHTRSVAGGIGPSLTHLWRRAENSGLALSSVHTLSLFILCGAPTTTPIFALLITDRNHVTIDIIISAAVTGAGRDVLE